VQVIDSGSSEKSDDSPPDIHGRNVRRNLASAMEGSDATNAKPVETITIPADSSQNAQSEAHGVPDFQ
jgi:hypothetical protein